MLNLIFSEKGLGQVPPPHFVYDFLRKMFVMLHSINWPILIAWLPLLLEISSNICIKIICQPGCDVIKFELSLIFLIKPICYMTKKSRQKLKYLENKKSFWSEIKSLFHHFKGLSVVKIVSDPRVRLWFLQQSFTSHHIIPNSNYMFKVHYRNTRIRCEICSKLAIKTPERCHLHRSGVFIVNFEHISYFVLVLLLLTLTRQIPAGNMINLILHHSPQTLVLLNLANA